MTLSTTNSDEPRLDDLLRWLKSWMTPEGAINGFHNHSVWGTNPLSFVDFTSGHAAFSAPALGGLAELVARHPDPRALCLLDTLIAFQSTALQPDGQYKHVGFQVGESASSGLIHNATASIGLLDAVRHAGHLLTDERRQTVFETVLSNLEALRVHGGGRPTEEGTCNQEYARVWVKLLYTQLSGDRRFEDEICDDLDLLIELFHQSGVPDLESSGTYRSAGDRHGGGILEPAEYYGLMIVPLILASEAYDEPRYLAEARRLCLHVVRSAWRDEAGATRFHRYWYVSPDRRLKQDTPMLIAGMGLTLYGMSQLLDRTDDDEIADFVSECLRTYAHYQVPAGYFLSATGWHTETDIAPSTAWHAHDLLFLAHRLDLPAGGWDAVFTAPEKQSVLATDRAIWSEDGDHWSIRSPLTAGDLQIHGRKSVSTFAKEHFSWTDRDAVPQDLLYPAPPLFFVANDGLYRVDDDPRPTDITVFGITYRGQM